MQTLDVLLIVSLYRHAAQTRPAGSFCNCKGIVVITLIATHKGSDMLGWDELHPVPHRLKATSPVMTGVTCFHGKLYRWLAHHKCCQLLPPNLLIEYHLVSCSHATHLEDVFCQINCN